MFQGKVILVVDDEADLREILRNELMYEGSTVFEASNGKEALEVLSKHHFDAVLSDIRMPGGDGATLASNIRSQNPNQPVIILITGFADIRSEEAYDLGADGYVLKPFHLDELKSTLRRLLTPPEQRWNQSQTSSAYQLTLPETLENSMEYGHVRLGRGGLFVETPASHFRNGDLITLSFKQSQPIHAQVRWVRSEGEAGKEPGVGLEFVHVPESVVSTLKGLLPNWLKEKRFIPKS